MVSFLLFSQVAFSLLSCVTVSRSVVSDSDPMDCSSAGSSVQARILQEVTITLSRRFCQLRD